MHLIKNLTGFGLIFTIHSLVNKDLYNSYKHPVLKFSGKARVHGISLLLHCTSRSVICSLLDLLGNFWQRSDQCRSKSDAMDVPVLDLHWWHM